MIKRKNTPPKSSSAKGRSTEAGAKVVFDLAHALASWTFILSSWSRIPVACRLPTLERSKYETSVTVVNVYRQLIPRDQKEIFLVKTIFRFHFLIYRSHNNSQQLIVHDKGLS